jgi:hypothetical protein
VEVEVSWAGQPCSGTRRKLLWLGPFCGAGEKAARLRFGGMTNRETNFF